MKKTMLTLLSGFALCLLGNAQETQKIELREISNDNGFEQVGSYWNANVDMNKKKPGGLMQKITEGRSGNCLQVKNTPSSVFAFYSRTLISVNLVTDTIKMTVYVKGKGKFQIGFYCYDKDKRFVTTFMKKDLLEVNSQGWTRKDFVYNFSTLKSPETSNVRITFEVKENSDLSFDDFSGILETRKAE